MRFRDIPSEGLKIGKQSKSSFDADRCGTEGAEENCGIEFNEDNDMERNSDDLNVYDTSLRR